MQEVLLKLSKSLERAQAAAMGGYIVAINNAAEKAFLLQHFSVSGDVNAPTAITWLGLTDEVREGKRAQGIEDPAVLMEGTGR